MRKGVKLEFTKTDRSDHRELELHENMDCYAAIVSAFFAQLRILLRSFRGGEGRLIRDSSSRSGTSQAASESSKQDASGIMPQEDLKKE